MRIFEAADGGTSCWMRLGICPYRSKPPFFVSRRKGNYSFGRIASSIGECPCAGRDPSGSSGVGAGRSIPVGFALSNSSGSLTPARPSRTTGRYSSLAWLFRAGTCGNWKIGDTRYCSYRNATVTAISRPGNVREVKAAVEFVLIHCRGTNIQPQTCCRNLRSPGIRSYHTPVRLPHETNGKRSWKLCSR